MQKYVNQLLADLEAAKNNVPPKPNVRVLYPDHPALEYEGLEYIAEWERTPYESMNTLFGIDVIVFPDAEKLSTEQLQQLVDAILDLWSAFNFYTTIPKGTPIHLIYNALIDKWKTGSVHYISQGMCGLEFCDYEPERCPWGMKHCTCKEFEDDDFDMDKYKMTLEQEAEWNKGLKNHPNGGISWVNPELLDKNGEIDPEKIKRLGGLEGGLPF